MVRAISTRWRLRPFFSFLRLIYVITHMGGAHLSVIYGYLFVRVSYAIFDLRRQAVILTQIHQIDLH